MAERFESGYALRRGLGNGGLLISALGVLIGVLGASLSEERAWVPVAAILVGVGGSMFGGAWIASRASAIEIADDALTVVRRGRPRRIAWASVVEARWSEIDDTEDAVPTAPGEAWVLSLKVEGRAIAIQGRDLANAARAKALLEKALVARAVPLHSVPARK